MLSIYTYPNNSGTGYIDPDYYGSTTGGSETGYYKRILDLKDGTYKTWVTGQTAPVDTVSDLITATGKFHKGVRTENGLENIMIYSYYNQPLITIDSVAIAQDITLGVPDASPAARLTVSDTSDFSDGDSVLMTGFDGTLATNNNGSMYVDVINSTTVDLYRDSALTNPLRYTSAVSSQPIGLIDYTTTSTSVSLNNQPLKLTLTGLGVGQDGSQIEFLTGSGNDWIEKLYDLSTYASSTNSGYYVRHDTGEIFDLYFNESNTDGSARPLTKQLYLGGGYYDSADSFLKVTNVKPYRTTGVSANIKVDANASGNVMWNIARYNSNNGVWNTGLKWDGVNGINEQTYFTPDATGDTGVDNNKNYLYTLEQNAFLTGAGIGHGYYIDPVYDDTGTVQLNDKRGDHVNWTPKAIYANWDGLSYQAGGQDIQNPDDYTGSTTNMQNRWFKGGPAEPVPYTQSFVQDSNPVDWTKPGGDTWKVSRAGIDYSTYQNASLSQRQAWFDVEIQWSDPTDNNNTEVDYIDLVWFNLSNPFGSPSIDPNYPRSNTTNIWDYLFNFWNSTTSQQTNLGEMTYVDLVLDGSSISYPMILQVQEFDSGFNTPSPLAGKNETRIRCYAWNADSSKKGNITTKLNLSGASQGLTNTQNTFTAPIKTYTAQSAIVTTGEFTTNSNYALYSNLENINLDETAMTSAYYWNAQGQLTGTGITVPNSHPYYDKLRTGTHITAVGNVFAQQRFLKLVSETGSSKTFTMHARYTRTGTRDLVDWDTITTITYTGASSVYIDGTNWFIRNTSIPGYKYWTPLNDYTEFFDGAEYNYYKLDTVSSPGTAELGGVTIADSTTGNIALNGEYAFKASNPHIYFPGNQIYKQRTGASTYVNAAIVEDDYYDENTGTSSDFTSGSGIKPVITISQSTEGYISGISLGDTGRLKDGGQKMLTIGATPDSYTPPTPTPAEQEDIWDTDDEWASDGSSQLKTWPDHVTPSSAVINYNSPTIVNNSQSGIKYTRSAGHTKWRLEVEYPPMSAEDFQEFHAIAQAAHGQSTPFYFKLRSKYGTNILWSDYYDLSNSTYTPRIKDPITAGDTTLLVEGFNSNESNAFKRGEVFISSNNENGFLHTSLSTNDSNVYGEAKIRTPWPFRQNKPAGSQIYKDPFWAVVTLASDSFEYQVDNSNHYFVSVAFDLDNWK
jgi:hypothetical protein